MQWTAWISSRKVTPGTSVIRREVLEQGPDRQRAPDRCSGGVSSIRGASESDAHTMDRPTDTGNSRGGIGHRSSPSATGLHEGGFMGGRWLQGDQQQPASSQIPLPGLRLRPSHREAPVGRTLPTTCRANPPAPRAAATTPACHPPHQPSRRVVSKGPG